jgi:hypothetical protein
VEPTGAEAGGSALVPYTSASGSSPGRPTRATLAKQHAPALYIPPGIRRSFLLLARYYRSPTSPPASPVTSCVLDFLHQFIQASSGTPSSPVVSPQAGVEQ